MSDAEIFHVKLSQEQKEKMVEDILENFDFERVHKVMAALEMTYMSHEPFFARTEHPSVNEKNVVPSSNYLKKFAEVLMWHVLNARSRYDTIYSGGFRVSFDPRTASLDIEFVIEQWCTYADEVK